MAQYRDYHRTVVGFHGTTKSTAERVVNGGDFRPSQNDYDWLGNGIYFWEYAPQQAWQWARQRYASSTKVAVLGSMIRLGNCFDLLDPENAPPLLEAKRLLESAIKPAPKNYNAKKYLDCAVFELFFKIREDYDGAEIDSTRAVYVPTGSNKRLWERSWLYRETHVQLCVRNPECILGTWLVQPK